MPHSHLTADKPNRFSAKLTQQLKHAFTLKRLGLSVAGTLAFAGAATAVHTVPAESTLRPDTGITSVQTGSSLPVSPLPQNTEPAEQPASSTGSNSAQSASNSNTNSVSVHVNGQNIPVPQNGSTHQTVTSTGGHTSVTVTSNTSSSGNSHSSSSSNVSLNVHTSSSSVSAGSSSQ